MQTVQLSRGYVALVDDEDYERVMAAGPWHAKIKRRNDGTIRNVYAGRTYRSGHTYVKQMLHRFLLGLTDPSVIVDHANTDGLDCRRENLRLATMAENIANSRKRLGCKYRHKGVLWHDRDRLWAARIRVDGRLKWLGSFKTEEEAAAAYLKAAGDLYGAFARPAQPAESR